uniref:Apolipoprotein A-IV n=1 Tax=Cyprinus carpio TaxID=7962 RepID=A0A8C2CKJ7_CYPCA
MKILAVLALAVFIGCQANLSNAEKPNPHLEHLITAFWNYIAKAVHPSDETSHVMRTSQLGQEVKLTQTPPSEDNMTKITKEADVQEHLLAGYCNFLQTEKKLKCSSSYHSARLTQSADIASEYAVTLKKQMDPLTEELMTKITKEAEVLKERLGQDLISVRDQLEPYADNLKSQIQQRVEELRTSMAPYADSLDSEILKATLLQQSEELRGNLEQSVKELQAQMEPYTAEIKEKVDQHLQEFQKTVTPLTEDLQAQLTSLYESFIKRN